MTGRQLIDWAMIEDGRTDAQDWQLYFAHFKTFCQHNLTRMSTSITAVQLPVEPAGYVKWPNDYLDFVCIGVKEGDRVRRMVNDPLLTLHHRYDEKQEEVVNDSEGTERSGQIIAINEQYYGTIFGIGSGRASERFREDRKNRRFVLNADFHPSEVLLEYLADQDVPDESTIIPHDAQLSCMRYMQWMVREISPSYHQYDKVEAKKRYNNAFSRMRGRRMGLTHEALYHTLRDAGRVPKG